MNEIESVIWALAYAATILRNNTDNPKIAGDQAVADYRESNKED